MDQEEKVMGEDDYTLLELTDRYMHVQCSVWHHKTHVDISEGYIRGGRDKACTMLLWHHYSLSGSTLVV